MKLKDIKNEINSQDYQNFLNIYQDDDGYYYFNLLGSIYLPEDMDSSYYTLYSVQPKDTYPLISYKHYNTVRLWWIICVANQIINPTTIPETALVLKIPSAGVVRNIISQMT